MHFFTHLTTLFYLASLLSAAAIAPNDEQQPRLTQKVRRWGPCHTIKPRFFILSLFTAEAAQWWNIKEFDLLAQYITIPGLSPRSPQAHCTADGLICQVITGEGEINAAASASAIWQSGYFDLRSTYFMIAGTAGINPNRGTIGDVIFQRFAVQVALQYEFDVRELNTNWSTPYVPYGTDLPSPAMYPQAIYGTEVFELNAALQQKAVSLASNSSLNDSSTAVSYRAMYKTAAATKKPSVHACDGATSDNYYYSELLANGFEAYMTLMTNGSSVYCTTAQEDSAILESLIRGAKARKLDFSRIILMRVAANVADSMQFDRQPMDASVIQSFYNDTSGGFPLALTNIYRAGIHVVQDVVKEWDAVYKAGVKPSNYVGDIFGTLGGTPDFGPHPYFGDV